MDTLGFLVGPAEIGRLYGTSRSRTGEITAAAGFPAPVATLGLGRVWRRRDVVAYAARTGRKLAVPLPEHETITDFICRCKPEGAAAADALIARVRERLAAGGPAIPAEKIVSAIVGSLEWDCGGLSVEIWCDQWFAVFAETEDGKARISVQCDRAEDGLAALWEMAAARRDAR